MFFARYVKIYMPQIRKLSVASLIEEGVILVITFAINILFGYWRDATKKFTFEWFLAIHLPIPVVYYLRNFYGVPLTHVPLFVIMYFLGQFFGGRVRRWFELRSSPTKCLVLDIVRLWYRDMESAR